MRLYPAALVTLSALLVCGHANAALKVLGEAADSDFDVVTTVGETRTASFSGILEPVTGIGISTRFTLVTGDTGGGTGPWALDVVMTGQSPGGLVSAPFNPIGGDVTIADFPLQNGAGVYGAGEVGDGMWSFIFSSDSPQAGWTYGLRNVTHYLLGDAPDVSLLFDATPDVAQEWDRPFFIEGISGQGPVAYHVTAFTVDTSGVYELSSVLASGSNHFTFLYENSFDPNDQLTDLLNYGLGNGFAQNGDPQGTSSFDSILIEGRTYYWITSQWAFFSTIETANNSIVGPGAITVLAPCASDLNGDGVVDTADLGALIAQFGTPGTGADLNNDNIVDTADLGILIGEFGAICP